MLILYAADNYAAASAACTYGFIIFILRESVTVLANDWLL